MTCDPRSVAGIVPGKYSLFGTDQYPSPRDDGPLLTDRQRRAAESGCVFLRCDESGAFHCAESFLCDVANAGPESIGCVGIPCGELGRCTDDRFFICEPTSGNEHESALDAHGCVRRNCEEGVACGNGQVCDYSRVDHHPSGCAVLRCDEPGGSCLDSTFKCAPDPELLPSGVQPSPDARGCVPKHCALDGFVCPQGMACTPEDPMSGDRGCLRLPPAVSQAGSGGVASTSGAGGASGAPSPLAPSTGGSAAEIEAAPIAPTLGYCANAN